MDDSEWSIQINGQLIDKTNSDQFRDILLSIPPIAVVEIIKTEISQDAYIITTHYEDKQFIYKLFGDKYNWNDDNLEELKISIRKKFNLDYDFVLYEKLNGDMVSIDDMDDVSAAFDDKHLLHLYINVASKLVNQFKIIYETNSFNWIPPNHDGDDEKQWDDNYTILLNEINKQYNIDIDDIQLQQQQDGIECDVDCGDDLWSIWDRLVNDESKYIATVSIEAMDDLDQEKDIGYGHVEDTLRGLTEPDNVCNTKNDLINVMIPNNHQHNVHINGETDIYDVEEVKMQNVEEIKEIDSESAVDIINKLIELGNGVGILGNDKKQEIYSALKGILEGAENGEENATEHFQNLLRIMLQNESEQYVECAVQFVKLLGYGIRSTNDEIIVNGQPNQRVLTQIKSNFHHLSNAIQKPRENIYQRLKIVIPNHDSITFHESGILDNKFITFQLPQIILEDQESLLVDKTILDPGDLERFVNFLVPNSSKYLCKEMYFDKLRGIQVQSIGLFGSRQEILDMLTKYNSISKPLYNALKNDEREYLKAGIHAILPVNLQKCGNFRTWNGIIYLFYWPLPNSFNMEKMKAVKHMKLDPSCLLTRVLYEISSTVCVQVSTTEVKDFGIVYEVDEVEGDQDQKFNEENKIRGKKKKRQKKKATRIKKMNFHIEETKENMILCNDTNTLKKQLKTNLLQSDENIQYFVKGDEIRALYWNNEWVMAEIIDIKEKTQQLSKYGSNLSTEQQIQLRKFNRMKGIYVHYIGFNKIYDQWIFLENDTLCDCIGDDCKNYPPHRIKPKHQQKKKGNFIWKSLGAIKGGLGVITGGLKAGNENNELEEKKHNHDHNDIACDTFMLNGLRMSGYCQMFKQKEREDLNTKKWEDWSKHKVKQFLIEWKQSFIDQGIDFLAESIDEAAFEQYNKEKQLLNKAEAEEKNNDNIKRKIDEILNLRQREILHEFHENYISEKHISQKYCKKYHQRLVTILDELQKNEALSTDLEQAACYIKLEPQQTTLPQQKYLWYRRECLQNMQQETGEILARYDKKQNKNDDAKNIVISDWFDARVGVPVKPGFMHYLADLVQGLTLGPSFW